MRLNELPTKTAAAPVKERWTQAELRAYQATGVLPLVGEAPRLDDAQIAAAVEFEAGQLLRQLTKDKRTTAEKLFDSDKLYWWRLRGEVLAYAFEPVKFTLANGLTYKPDYRVVMKPKDFETPPQIDFYEVKGEKRGGKLYIRDGAGEKLKMAARLFPEHRWFLVWRDPNNQKVWKRQEVLP